MKPFSIPVLLGTGRKERRSEVVARFVHKELSNQQSCKTALVDVRDFDFTFTDNSEETALAARWKKIVSEADGLVIVAPEYNNGYPGELKLLLDSVYDEYARKPVGLCGVSSGRFGGARMIQSLKPILIELQLVVVSTHVYFGPVKEVFDKLGKLQEKSIRERLHSMFGELLWFARVLREGRKKYRYGQ